jgi:hypothetical protein
LLRSQLRAGVQSVVACISAGVRQPRWGTKRCSTAALGILPALSLGRAGMPIPQDEEFNFWKSLKYVLLLLLIQIDIFKLIFYKRYQKPQFAPVILVLFC